MPRRTMRTLVIICCTLIIPGVAHAQDPVEKVGRGLTNVLSGWIELPKQIHLGLHSDHPVAGVGWGLIKGTGLAVMRIGVGLYEAVTFPIPFPRGYASPYASMELPDYAWDTERVDDPSYTEPSQ